MTTKVSRNKMKILKLFQLLPLIYSWIHQAFMPSEQQTSTGKYKRLILKLEKAFDRGPEAGISYAKAVRTNFLNYLSGNQERAPGVKCTSDGIPLVLNEFAEQIRRGDCPREILAGINTVLFATRALKLGTLVDTTSITEPTIVVSPDISKYAKSFWRELGYSPSMAVPSALNWRRFHFTTKAGPNGHALHNSIVDLYLLPESLIQSIKVVGGEKLTLLIERLVHPASRTLLSTIVPTTGKRIRKLSSFSDKEMKVRVIAVLDYFSQTALIPLHRYLYRVLKKIPQDCTFDQGGFWSKIKDSEDFYSVDLTAATDRFPMDLLCQVLEAKLPPSYVSHWKDIMVGYPFEFDGKLLTYAVGNPMGAYSSWASFAVAHHYVVYYCCRELGRDWRTLKYALLGDDIVIADREVGEKYHEVILSLGLEVSNLKTHKSKNLVEFAKRLFYKSKEITPFPISAMKETGRRYYLLTNLLQEQEKREWMTCDGIPSLVASYYSKVRKRPVSYCKKMEERSFICEQIAKAIRGTLPADVALNAIIRQLAIPISRPLTEEESMILLRSSAKDVFADSYARFSKPGRGLGDLAFNLVCTITSWDSVTNAGGVESSDIPVLQAYGLIEEMFMDLYKETSGFTIENGEWPLWLKALALPIDDKVFSEKSVNTYLRGSIILGDKVINRLVGLSPLPGGLESGKFKCKI